MIPGKKSKKKSLYETYGGFEFFHSCIYELYHEMFMHPEISLHFLDVDIKRLSFHQTQFLVRQIGGPRLYQGKPIGWVHRRMEISEFQFQEIAAAFERVFLRNGMTPKDAQVIMSFIVSKKPKIVTVRWAWIDLMCWPFYRLHALMHHIVDRVLAIAKPRLSGTRD